MRSHSIVIVVVASAAAFCGTACGSTDRGTPDGSPTPDSSTGTDGGTTPMMVPNNVPVPMTRPASSDLLQEATAACQRLIGQFERDVVMRCNHSPSTQAVVSEFADLHAELIETRPLPGRGLESFAVAPSEVTLSGEGIEVISCTSSPLCTMGDCGPAGMNAFAVTNVAVTIDPLLRSFAEGAAYWGTLVEAADGEADDVNVETLLAGLGTIYAAHSQGRPWQTIDEATVTRLLTEDEFVNEMFVGVTAFLYMHELAHADLGHSVINHTAAAGAQQVLMAEGRTLTPEESAALAAELRTLKVFTETQADIYAATLLREAGFASDAPVVLFTAAMAAFYVASGACSAAMTQEQLYDCAVQRNPNAAHPPLDVRATVLRRIIDDGEDLSGQLELIQPE